MMRKCIAATACATFLTCAVPAMSETLDVASTFGTNNLLGQMGVKFAEERRYCHWR